MDYLSINRQEEKELEYWFKSNGYEILNFNGLVKYLCENYYIRNTQDVVERNLELREAENVPLEWLDYETIIAQDEDFYPLSKSRFLNIYEIVEDTYEHKQNKGYELFKYIKLSED